MRDAEVCCGKCKTVVCYIDLTSQYQELDEDLTISKQYESNYNLKNPY